MMSIHVTYVTMVTTCINVRSVIIVIMVIDSNQARLDFVEEEEGD